MWGTSSLGMQGNLEALLANTGELTIGLGTSPPAILPIFQIYLVARHLHISP